MVFSMHNMSLRLLFFIIVHTETTTTLFILWRMCNVWEGVWIGACSSESARDWTITDQWLMAFWRVETFKYTFPTILKIILNWTLSVVCKILMLWFRAFKKVKFALIHSVKPYSGYHIQFWRFETIFYLLTRCPCITLFSALNQFRAAPLKPRFVSKSQRKFKFTSQRRGYCCITQEVTQERSRELTSPWTFKYYQGGKVQDGDITRVSHNEDAVEGLMGVVNCFNRLGRRHEEDTKTGDERGGWRKWLPRDRGRGRGSIAYRW